MNFRITYEAYEKFIIAFIYEVHNNFSEKNSLKKKTFLEQWKRFLIRSWSSVMLPGYEDWTPNLSSVDETTDRVVSH